MNEFFENLHRIGIVPVIKINDANQAIDLARALCRGGLPAAEITFRSNAAEDAIYAIAKNVPDVCVCAGTVLTIENAERAVDAGAKAIISPGTNPEVVTWCIAHGVPVVPGCATPTEIEACMRMGLDTVKLFPAEVVGGVKMLKALSGPYSNMKFMPTGGVSPSNVGDYLTLSNVVACGGSWIAPEKLLDAREFDQIEKLARDAANLVAR
nr:bifunctional 4-hydroxy-2-oxoglutarate aldolase/2-dehydro-3-deoxy-phosphogluconate aldolase [uncultured Caproiciproducens sp.]